MTVNELPAGVLKFLQSKAYDPANVIHAYNEVQRAFADNGAMAPTQKIYNELFDEINSNPNSPDGIEAMEALQMLLFAWQNFTVAFLKLNAIETGNTSQKLIEEYAAAYLIFWWNPKRTQEYMAESFTDFLERVQTSFDDPSFTLTQVAPQPKLAPERRRGTQRFAGGRRD